MIVAFDVAKVPARLSEHGQRDTSRPVWTRVVTDIEVVWRNPITRAALLAAQFAGATGMVTDVLLRE